MGTAAASAGGRWGGGAASLVMDEEVTGGRGLAPVAGGRAGQRVIRLQHRVIRMQQRLEFLDATLQPQENARLVFI